MVDFCSGDISIFLGLIRDIFSLSIDQNQPICERAIKIKIQDRAIRENANDFLNRIETIPNTGPKLRKIAVAFGKVANYYLKNLNSGNQDREPPWQAFRIELRENPQFPEETLGIYNDLIKYGIFFRDVRGKSIRGDVVPRLYLRRLLIPSFKLTPNMRDSISIEPEEFILLLDNPEGFYEHMKKKSHSIRSDRWQTKLGQ